MTKPLLVVTDVGLIVYWAATALGVISVGKIDVLQAWNWSFLPLDLAAAVSGLVWSVFPRAHPYRAFVLTISLTLTHTAGLMALGFFVLWGSWDWTWWAPNLWLGLLPLGLGARGLWATRAPQRRSSIEVHVLRGVENVDGHGSIEVHVLKASTSPHSQHFDGRTPERVRHPPHNQNFD